MNADEIENTQGMLVAAGDLLRESTDTLSREKRSQLMSNVRHKDTKPELAVRSALHEMGIQFQFNRTDLPGTPDIVLSEYRTVIFVHGCFWHRHPNCKKATTPKQNADFWKSKFERNMARDTQKVRDLEALGWQVLIVWECEASKSESLLGRLRVLLQQGKAEAEIE
jgi:DNA mismatch endonuclease (patch repair protein)